MKLTILIKDAYIGDQTKERRKESIIMQVRIMTSDEKETLQSRKNSGKLALFDCLTMVFVTVFNIIT